MEKRNSLYTNIAEELNLGELKSQEIIQNLWSNYGELVRLRFHNKSIIVKHIKLPKNSAHPKGWNTKLSHQRKLHSYEVEVNWYEKFSKNIDARCPIPKGLMTYKSENEYLIVMEDLASSGFDCIVKEASENHIKSSLRWLANFHARYMNTHNPSLWKTGTYWHLDTRPDELEALEDKELKKYAFELDSILKNAKYQTLVHGDAKLANFCFNNSGTLASAVDFQYVGQGCAMKDVILFISSAIKPEDLENMQDWCLDTYFKELDEALKYYQCDINSAEVESEYRELFCIAWADFQRFLKGWSPNHFKINTYTENLTKRAFVYMKSNR